MKIFTNPTSPKKIQAHPELHDEKSNDKIWRYAQRTHFHATGVAAFSLGLIILIMLSDMQAKLKTASSILIGLGSFYPLSWFTMVFACPFHRSRSCTSASSNRNIYIHWCRRVIAGYIYSHCKPVSWILSGRYCRLNTGVESCSV